MKIVFTNPNLNGHEHDVLRDVHGDLQYVHVNVRDDVNVVPRIPMLLQIAPQETTLLELFKFGLN